MIGLTGVFDSQSARIGDITASFPPPIPGISRLWKYIDLGNIIALYSTAHESNTVIDGAGGSRRDRKALIEQQPVKTNGDTEVILEVVQYEEKVVINYQLESGKLHVYTRYETLLLL